MTTLRRDLLPHAWHRLGKATQGGRPLEAPCDAGHSDLGSQTATISLCAAQLHQALRSRGHDEQSRGAPRGAYAQRSHSDCTPYPHTVQRSSSSHLPVSFESRTALALGRIQPLSRVSINEAARRAWCWAPRISSSRRRGSRVRGASSSIVRTRVGVPGCASSRAHWICGASRRLMARPPTRSFSLSLKDG